MNMPAGNGSLFYNYKHYVSVLLLTLVAVKYCFITLDVGEVGKSNDSTAFKNLNK